MFHVLAALLVYEALTPFAVWMMAEGVLTEDFVLTLFWPVISLSGHLSLIASRQDEWIEFWSLLRDITHLIVD
jgi:hypothetical protein